jgi:hypothetical protein
MIGTLTWTGSVEIEAIWIIRDQALIPPGEYFNICIITIFVLKKLYGDY